MIILTENNAFQNIGKCLSKQCTHINQIEDFLQFCIQIIFYERINIAGLVPKYVMQDSAEIMNILSQKYEIKIFDFKEITNDNDASNLISQVSRIISYNIDEYLKILLTNEDKDNFTSFPYLSNDSIALIKQTTRAINNKDIKFLSGDIVKYSNISTDSGLFKILNENNTILEKIIQFAKNNQWTDSMSLKMLSNIKLLLNKELSKTYKQIFSPSVRRGREEKHQNTLIIKKIDNIFKEAKEYIGYDDSCVRYVEMPSLIQYIVTKSQGDISNILKLTMELRNKFEPVRNYISDLNKDTSSTTQIIMRINQISNQIFNSLKGAQSSKGLVRIIENTLIPTAGVSRYTASIPWPNLKEIRRLNKLDLCATAFTEVIDDMILYQTDNYTNILIKNCLS